MECCPKAVIGWVANCCVWVELSMSGCKSGQQGTLCIRKYRCDYVLPPLLSTGHMAMNADLLVPGSNVFYLRGTTGERVPATVVGLLSFPECVAISYERSGHTQLYCDCPVERFFFPHCARGAASKHGVSPPPTAAVGSRAVAADVQDCPETESLNVALQDDSKQFQVALIISQNPWATMSLSEKVVQYIGK